MSACAVLPLSVFLAEKASMGNVEGSYSPQKQRFLGRDVLSCAGTHTQCGTSTGGHNDVDTDSDED